MSGNNPGVISIQKQCKVVDLDIADYAVIAGIQIHGPEENYTVPANSYVMISGYKKKLEI